MNKNSTYWLVTVTGYDSYYSPPNTSQTLAVKLEGNQTPIDWFISKSECYFRFSFIPCCLFNFWSITKEQYTKYMKDEEEDE